MLLGPHNFPASLSIAVDKVVRYLLDVNHPKGGSKAVLFLAHGFSTEQPDRFAAALFAHACLENYKGSDQSHWGVRHVFEGHLITPDGRNPRLRSIWQAAAEHEIVWLLTAYPLPRPNT